MDAIRFAGGMNFYVYCGDDPVNFTDSKGESRRDVNRIKNDFKSIVSSMTELGMRHNNRYWNKLASPIQKLLNSAGLNTKGPFLGCGDQRNLLKSHFDNVRFDDNWQFQKNNELLGAHKNLRAVSNDPNDPILIIDPWKNSIIEE